MAIKFPNVDVQEREKGWNQVDLLMIEIPTQNLYQLQLHITKEIILRSQVMEVDFEMFASKHEEIQKAHLELKEKQVEMQKVQESQHTTVQNVYQRVIGE